VGTARILGRVHLTQMKFGNSYFPVSITVLESEGVDFLLGLDMLRRYRSCLDLSLNVLRFHIEGRVEEVRFLSEGEAPRSKLFGGPNDNEEQEQEPSVAPTHHTDEELGEKVAGLMALGFSDQQARDALERTGGDPAAAASLLLND
jgi:DNA damage-inducible protein 1